MRIARCLLAFAAFTLPLVVTTTPLAAQQQAPTGLPQCDGNYNIVRVSEIKPGMMQKFLDAVTAQAAWYKKTGSPDQIAVMRIFDRDSHAYSETEAITTHVGPASRPPMAAHDADYDAFVALFRASSTIKSEYLTCVIAK